ncbi:WhiB family transcriptional regulator [Streptomyces sp. NPDC051452]|uniref:WhiB family transcriptional regulator n=1 Tax=Streptomyces sp. NPDC051452 TaxID=3365654 RepID=UPI003798AEE2
MAYTGSVPDTGGHRLDWMAHMACRTEDPDTFSNQEHEHNARLICAVRCPVRTACLANVKNLENGQAEVRRDGVVAGLTAHERWRLDASAPGHSDKPALVFTGPAPDCGTYTALLRHLWFGERVDSTCWSAEVRRERLSQATGAANRRSSTKRKVIAPKKKAAAPRVVAPTRSTQASSKPRPKSRGETPHERRVYSLWASGLSDIAIARAMAVSVPSVQRVCERLGLIPNAAARAS